MKQIIQNLKTGETSLEDVPCPSISRGNLLINTHVSLISSGTEKMLLDFGKGGYFSKAMQQPEKVKEVLSKIKTDGIESTYEAVQSKLSNPIPLGYCNVGKIIEVGDGVEKFRVGDRVVSNGHHAEIVSVPTNLCARIPDNVSNEQASFVVLSAIALQGIRLANLTIGERVAVIGLGAIGLMAVQILIAHGCTVLAFDLNDDRLQLAKSFGASVINSSEEETKVAIDNFTSGFGMDAVIITAASKGNEIIQQAAKMSRKRGRIILVGVTGLNLSRDDFYEKELSFQVSCSYGPGRYDPFYEQQGNDYPHAYVRWTEQRNFEAILSLMSSKKINPIPLISHEVMFEDSPSLYSKIADGAQGLGMILQYSSITPEKKQSTMIINTGISNNADDSNSLAVGFFGAGNYASRVLMPEFHHSKIALHTVVTSKGLSGTIAGKRFGFINSSTEKDAIFKNKEINIVAIATRHDSHSDLVSEGLMSSKHVFVEKPLAINFDGLDRIKNSYYSINNASNSAQKIQLMVGFNRRFSPHIVKMKSLLETIKEPKSFIMTMNAGSVSEGHWTNDLSAGGGRIIGEACHYIDLMRFLAGVEIEDFTARKMSMSQSGNSNNDTATITLSFKDGSFGTINYLANGHSSFPKESIQVFSSSRVLVLDNFRSLHGYGWKNFKSMKTWKQDKGQNKCIEKFLSSISTGEDAIPVEELFEVTGVTLAIAKLIHEQA